MYGQTVIHYMAVLPVAFPVTTAITATTATTATGFSTDLLTVIIPVITSSATVSISLRKPLKNRPIDSIIWHLRCSHPGKETLENMVKRATKNEIEALTTL